MKKILRLFAAVFKEWEKHNATRLAAALSYYAVFSLAPIIVLLISLSRFFLKSEDVQKEIIRFFAENISNQSAQTIQSMMESASLIEGSLAANVFGIIILLVGASAAFNQLQYAFNRIWNVQIRPDAGLIPVLKKRLFSFFLILIIGIFILASLFLSAALSFGIRFFSDMFPQILYLLPAAELFLSWGIISILFTLMFQYLPDVKLKWAYVWRGGVLTGLLFFIGKALLSWYFTAGDVLSSYGVAGSFIAILLWMNYSSLILFFGAEFTQVWTRQRGIRIIPVATAVHSDRKIVLNVSYPSVFQKLTTTWKVLKAELRLVRFFQKIKRLPEKVRHKFFKK